MPQALHSRIPPASGEYEVTGGKKGIEEKDSGPDQGRISPVIQTSSPPRRGVFPFSFEWQLAGLISAIVTGFLLSIASLDAQLPIPFLLALGLLTLSIYSAVKTNWLREVSAKPLSIKIGAGAAVICGLVPIGATLTGLAIAVAICALVLGALGAFGGK